MHQFPFKHHFTFGCKVLLLRHTAPCDSMSVYTWDSDGIDAANDSNQVETFLTSLQKLVIYRRSSLHCYTKIILAIRLRKVAFESDVRKLFGHPNVSRYSSPWWVHFISYHDVFSSASQSSAGTQSKRVILRPTRSVRAVQTTFGRPVMADLPWCGKKQ